MLDDKDNKGHNTAQLSSCLQIKYACLKNIGALHGSRGNLDEALDAYLEVESNFFPPFNETHQVLLSGC